MKSTKCNKRFPLLFKDVWEFLDFKRGGTEVSCTSPDGLIKASLKKEGSSFWYTLTSGEDAQIFTTLLRFRATERRLMEFHVGCARVVRDMKRYLRTQDPKWLKADRPFGKLHGGVVLSNGNVMWRGNSDDIDPDEWIDMVEDESLARLLDQVDRLQSDSSGQPNEEINKKRAWELLETVPKHHEYHVEVLRRRVTFFDFLETEDQKRCYLLWARALVEAEPYDVVNWWSLFWVVEELEGKAAAVEIVKEGIKRHGPDFTLYYELASLLCALGRLNEAKKAMQLALQEDIFAFKSAMQSESFAPIHNYIQELNLSDWFIKEKERLETRYPSEKFDL
jgi:tetratricopeptide (TPR) repeat protein